MKRWRLISDENLEKLIQERIAQEAGQSARNYERDLLMKQASLMTLQSQINPHFLYNALECIRGQALLDGSIAAAKTAQTLSHFFRYSISGKSNIATLADELDNVKSYVTLQQFRFRDRFSYDVDMGEDGKSLLGAVLPKLTLQPVVENAIIHGFSQTTSGGILKISIRKLDLHISIVVSDNGTGMDGEKLKRFREKLLGTGEESNDERYTGIGMFNVNRRLKLYFGESYGITADSCVGIGTSVEMFFPYCESLKKL